MWQDFQPRALSRNGVALYLPFTGLSASNLHRRATSVHDKTSNNCTDCYVEVQIMIGTAKVLTGFMVAQPHSPGCQEFPAICNGFSCLMHNFALHPVPNCKNLHQKHGRSLTEACCIHSKRPTTSPPTHTKNRHKKQLNMIL